LTSDILYLTATLKFRGSLTPEEAACGYAVDADLLFRDLISVRVAEVVSAGTVLPNAVANDATRLLLLAAPLRLALRSIDVRDCSDDHELQL
jgi:hypothetical protein